MTDGWDFDVAVVGGGPAGSACAAALRRRGHSVLVIERERFPRFHIGESQLPWINEALNEIGAADAVAAAGFVRKWGASFMTAEGEWSQYADFSRAVETPEPQTYQVPRDRFDQVLLDHAAGLGADVRQSHRAEDVHFGADAVTLTFTGPDETTTAVRAGAVVDASGRNGFLAKRFGERRQDPLLQNIAIHRQYEGVPRDEGRRRGDIRMVTRSDGGWFWFIPISERVTSVGVVIPKASYRAEAGRTADDTLERVVAETPSASALLNGARPVTAARFEADYSYMHSRLGGDRFVLVGDAAAFLDPIFSTGVLLAMQSGIEAAKALSEGLRGGGLGAARFADYERQVRNRYDHFRRFVVGFYDPAFRDLWFSPSSRFGIYEAVLSVLAGNWRPSLGTRIRLRLFFLLVAVQRVWALAPRQALDVQSPRRTLSDAL